MLTYRKHQSFAINMFAYIGSIIKETKFNRRKNIGSRGIATFRASNEAPGMARCKCGRTYWITYDLSKELFPEYNRKSKYKMSFK